MLIIYRGCIMIRDKKGVISVSVIYSFFLIFCLLLILIMTTYTNNRINFKLLKNDIKKVFISSKSVNTVTLKSKITDSGYNYSSLDDDLGESKYLTNNSSNYIYFGVKNTGEKMLWRIIRINGDVNGDGSIRLIYNDSIGNGQFNVSNNDAVYTGYMFSPNVRNGLTTDSKVKETIDSWYKDNLKNTIYEQYISPSIFCVNRNSYTSESKSTSSYGFGQDTQYFLDHRSFGSFKCDSNSDRFDTRINYEGLSDNTIQGNGALTYMIGLLTASEASKISTTVRGTTGTWTLSPSHYNSSGAYVYYANSSNVNYKQVSTSGGIRPVISIKADTEIVDKADTNYGKQANPFILATNQGTFDTGGVCS